VEKYCRAEEAIDDSMGHAHNATNTLSEYVTLIVFPLEQWLHGRATVLRCTYIAFVFLNVRDWISQP